MTKTADRSPLPTPARPARPGRTSAGGAARDELARLRGRKLGACEVCGKPVFLERNFTRSDGRVVHVRCPIGTSTPAPATAAMLADSGGA